MEKQGSRALLAAVIGMGILLFIGSLALVGVLVHRMMHPAAPHPVAVAGATVPAPVMAGPGVQAGDLVVEEAPGTHVQSVTARPDGLLAVVLTGGESVDRVVLWDPAGHRIVARLVLGRS
ncbi:hypothetical protein Gxy13693_024_077 [Komagataeibacter xylinus NBRC 13693]|uniref:Uncharacterized protein n=2 Tax=Komagataeibacter TaxID=1434011 RepID=A0A0D6QA05_KOMXY|nr:MULTISPECIES: hypothetical protein [Komagataeibacter]MBV0887185.1 hypothetical protein [Komagataeibacter oboediens]MCK9819443.1 hypothetical protein [Komagataeibacter oboediens]PYD83437.1 hypothetical protein CFR80_00650 [Komagataeibacter oboediens]GAN99661.1 hypothetical protein Gxy13693_024_077 [Komagataeibacter xylinus NBRC 13693]